MTPAEEDTELDRRLLAMRPRVMMELRVEMEKQRAAEQLKDAKRTLARLGYFAVPSGLLVLWLVATLAMLGMLVAR